MFGILDMVAIGNGESLGIQMTSKSNMSSRIKKIQESEYLPELIRSKWRIIVIGWFKKPNGRYDYKEFEFWSGNYWLICLFFKQNELIGI